MIVMGTPILFGVGLYAIVMLTIGYLSSKKIKGLADFLVAGRKLPFYLATATLFATWYGGGTCMGAAGAAYSKGILGVIADPFAAGAALILAGIFYVGLLRRLELMTVTDIFGRYYGKGAEVFASLLMVPVYIGWLGAQIVALGFVLNVFTGVDPTTGIILGALVIMIYTFAGGMWAVALTDFVNCTLLIISLLIFFPMVLNQTGGWEALTAGTPSHFWRIVPKNPGYQGWVTYAGQWFLMGLGCVVGQDIIQRSLASTNERVAEWSAVTAGFMYLTLGLIPVFMGFVGRIAFPELENSELVIPFLAMKYLSGVFLVVFLGALISIIMSSADSSLLAATSLMTRNIVGRLIPKPESINMVSLARVITCAMTGFALIVALYVKQIYHLMVNSWATLFVGILVPVTAALYWKKANKTAAWTSMVLGTGTWIGYILIRAGNFQDISDPTFYQAATYGGAVSLLSYLLATGIRWRSLPDVMPACAFRKLDKDQPITDAEVDQVKKEIRKILGENNPLSVSDVDLRDDREG